MIAVCVCVTFLLLYAVQASKLLWTTGMSLDDSEIQPLMYDESSQVRVSIETATAMHTKGTEGNRNIFIVKGQPPVSLGVEG